MTCKVATLSWVQVGRSNGSSGRGEWKIRVDKIYSFLAKLRLRRSSFTRERERKRERERARERERERET
jgi:hypothetical protein